MKSEIERGEEESKRESEKDYFAFKIKFEQRMKRFLIAFLVGTFLESFTGFVSLKSLEMVCSYSAIVVIIMSYLPKVEDESPTRKWIRDYISIILGIIFLIILIIVKNY